MPMMLLSVLTIVTLDTIRTRRTLLRSQILAIPRQRQGTNILRRVTRTHRTILIPTRCPNINIFRKRMLPNVTIHKMILTRHPPYPLKRVEPPLMPKAHLFKPTNRPTQLLRPLMLARPTSYDPHETIGILPTDQTSTVPLHDICSGKN